MKHLLKLLALSCSIVMTAQVKKIQYDFAKQTTSFFNDEEEKKENTYTILNEKDNFVLIEITDYNPLRYDFTINHSDPVSFYQNKLSNFTFFGEIITKPKDEKVQDSVLVNEKTIDFPLIPKNDPKKNFKIFNDALVNIKNTIEILKTRKSLNENEITNQLSSFVIIAKDEEPECEGLNCATNFRIRKQKLIDAVNEEILSLEKELETENKKSKKDKKETEIKRLTTAITEYKALSKKIEEKE